MQRLLSAAVVCLTLSLPAGSAAATWYVTAEGTGDAPTIQAAIDSAAAGDTVLVGSGTYTGEGNRDLNLRGKELVVRSESGPEHTVIDCQGSRTSQHRGFNFSSGESPAAVLEGFTIQGGYGPFDFSFPRSVGGGISCLYSSPTITGCVFRGNEADYGGGIFAHYSAPAVVGCSFEGNQATWPGGGVYCSVSSPLITNCSFSHNTAGTSGGGVYCYRSSPAIVLTVFWGNDAALLGGGLSCSRYSAPAVNGCTFSENGALAGGGAVACNSSSSPLFENTIIAFSSEGGALHCADEASAPVLRCCDVYGNEGGDYVGCIADQYGTDGNFSEDPLFCEILRRELKLQQGSPCILGYGCGRIGAFHVGCLPRDPRNPGHSGAPASEEVSERAVHGTWGLVKSLFETP